MTNHIVDISDNAARLHVSYSRLIIEREESPQVAIPLAEIAVLIVGHSRIRLTQSVLSGIANAGGILVACDSRRLPAGMMLPVQGHHQQVARYGKQAIVKMPTKKRLWQQIVQAKIRSQALVLEEILGSDRGLRELAVAVRSGDPLNVEARAARRYWLALFGASFRRNRDARDGNLLLNYGYGVLRAIVARAICAAGLHPSLGLHHHNRSSGFPLSDDLMEPFRAIVDRVVFEVVQEEGIPDTLTANNKRPIVSRLLGRIDWAGEQRTIFDATTRLSSSLVKIFCGERRDLELG